MPGRASGAGFWCWQLYLWMVTRPWPYWRHSMRQPTLISMMAYAGCRADATRTLPGVRLPTTSATSELGGLLGGPTSLDNRPMLAIGAGRLCAGGPLGAGRASVRRRPVWPWPVHLGRATLARTSISGDSLCAIWLGWRRKNFCRPHRAAGAADLYWALLYAAPADAA